MSQPTNIRTKYLADYLQRVDELHIARKVTTGEYIQIGLLIKILEANYKILEMASVDEIK